METIEAGAKEGTTQMVATVAAAFFQNNPVPVSDIDIVIQKVRNGLLEISGSVDQITPTTEEPKVPIKDSVKRDYIVCLEDGKKLKMLKRHLMSSYKLTPGQYRTKWGLPSDYPMVAPSYVAQRRELAMASGLGHSKSKQTSSASDIPQEPKAPQADKPRRGRPPKVK